MADPATLISGLLSNLAPLIKDEFSLFWNLKKDVENLSKTLSAINATLEHAEIKNAWKKDIQTEGWLRELKDVAYEVRDIMDDCTFEDLRLQARRRDASSSTRIQVTNYITHPFRNTRYRRKIGYKIKDVQEKLNQIYSRRQNLQLPEPVHDSKKIHKFTSSWRETMSLSSCAAVYGRDEEKKQIIDILLNKSSVGVATVQLSVLPIVGIGGLGKTTFAQMVFNDEEVSKHFDTKIWVCVSDEFDIKLVVKSILKEKEKASFSLEELQEKVRYKLRGKRYLIVLDDVWNENVCAWDQLRSILDCGANGAFVLTTTRKRRVAEIMETIPNFELPSLSYDDCWLLFKERAFKFGEPKDPSFVNIGEQITRKCKGVPLVAKIIGSHLGFCDDEKEWHRIRDNEIWEISKNEEDLMPILRLSYYDLSYQLRRCFAFCAIFPKDTVIEKERLIQFWMAHGLILPDTNQEVEDAGNIIWKELCWRSFFQDVQENKVRDGTVQTTCMMHDLMHDLSQSVMKDECYTMNAKKSSDDLVLRHVTVKVDQFETLMSVHSLKKIGGLQSIIFDGTDYKGNVTKEILSVLKELLALRVLEIRRHVQYQDLIHVRCLKHLRYLDIFDSKITTLPDSIGELFNLQILKLNYCSNLGSLPRNMRNLINLRHLYLKDCIGLKYMPRGLGQLKHLKTLSTFVIGEEIDCCQLDEIKELDIGGSLKIRNLERVSDASIARGINMAKWSSITTLELYWGYDADADADGHEKISEALEVSTVRLKTLKMTGYKGVNPPKWVGKSSPSIGSSSSSEMMIVLFPLLEELTISDMENLRELVSPTTIPSTGAFLNLCKLEIFYCPKLGALPPQLKSLKDVSVKGECSDELLYSISNLSALTHLTIFEINKKSVLFPSTLTLADNNEAQLGGGGHSTIQSLSIWKCKKLRRLFDSGMIMKEEITNGCEKQQKQQHHHLQAERTRDLMNSLTKLEIGNCPELMISVEEIGNLNSLQSLSIWDCPKLESSEDVIGPLRSLRARLDPIYFHVYIEEEEEESIRRKTDMLLADNLKE